MNIFVGNLSFKTTEEELQKEFEAFGEVGSVKIILDQATLKSRGFAFITMPHQDQATAAIKGLNGKEIAGFALKVNEARPRDSRGSGGTSSANSTRSGFGFSSRTDSASGGFDRSRTGGAPNNQDLDIYDTKGSRSGGGHGKKSRGGGGRGGSGGRSGGGKHSY